MRKLPSAIREVVGEFAPRVSGAIVVRPKAEGPKQDPPLPVDVELAEGAETDADLSAAIEKRLREALSPRCRSSWSRSARWSAAR